MPSSKVTTKKTASASAKTTSTASASATGARKDGGVSLSSKNLKETYLKRLAIASITYDYKDE
jgi:hypothetical protein